MKLGEPLPALDGAPLWIHGRPEPEALAGKAVLVHFWSTSCPLCHEGAAAIARWRMLGSDALACIGICALRDGDAMDAAQFEREATGRMRIAHSCALDAAGLIAARFGDPYAPAYFLFDRSHVLRHRQEGNAALAHVDVVLRTTLM